MLADKYAYVMQKECLIRASERMTEKYPESEKWLLMLTKEMGAILEETSQEEWQEICETQTGRTQNFNS